MDKQRGNEEVGSERKEVEIIGREERKQKEEEEEEEEWRRGKS